MNKEIYFYWGNQPMSYLRYMMLKSFEILNPDWDINLISNQDIAENKWTSSEEQDNVNYRGYDYRNEFHKIKTLNHISLDEIFPINYQGMSNVHIKDILNWYLLSTRSCVVADMDILFSLPISKTEEIDWDADVNLCSYDFFNSYIPVSFMVSKVDDTGINPLYEKVYQNSIKVYNKRVYESCGYNAIPYDNIDHIIDQFKDLKIHKMESEIVFPFAKINLVHSGKLCWEEGSKFKIDEKTIGIHWYGGQPISQKYNNIITDKNYKEYNNIITQTINKLI